MSAPTIIYAGHDDGVPYYWEADEVDESYQDFKAHSTIYVKGRVVLQIVLALAGVIILQATMG